jgi:hypothetical protein
VCSIYERRESVGNPFAGISFDTVQEVMENYDRVQRTIDHGSNCILRYAAHTDNKSRDVVTLHNAMLIMKKHHNNANTSHAPTLCRSAMLMYAPHAYMIVAPAMPDISYKESHKS